MRNASLTPVTIPATGRILLVLPSKHRRSLTFSPNVAAGYTASTDPAVVENAGLVVTSGGGCVTVDFDTHGPLVQQAWYGYNAGVTAMVVAVLEAFDVGESM